MHVALIADTHGWLDPRIADAIRGVDVLVHAGDVGSGVVAAMTPLAPRLVIVRGNNDPRDRHWPASDTVALPGGELTVVHGHQWPAKTRHHKARDRFADAAAIVCGHSHRRVLDTRARPWLLNPGAAGRTRAYGGPGFITLDIDADGRWQVESHVYESFPKR